MQRSDWDLAKKTMEYAEELGRVRNELQHNYNVIQVMRELGQDTSQLQLQIDSLAKEKKSLQWRLRCFQLRWIAIEPVDPEMPELEWI